MATLQSELSSVSSSNSIFNTFDASTANVAVNSLFSQPGMDPIAFQQAQLKKLHQQQRMLQHQHKLAHTKSSSHQYQQQQIMNGCTSSDSSSPIPRYSPPNLAPAFGQTVTPEKSAPSNSPPSPADSGVVSDSKSEGGTNSHDLLQSLEQSKLDDGLEFLSSNQSIPSSLGFCVPSSAEDAQNLLSFQSDGLNSMNSLGLSNSNNLIHNVNLGLSSSDDVDPTISPTVSQNIAAIWSSPPTVSNPLPTPTPSVDDMILQSLQQHQHQHQQQQQQHHHQQMTSGWPNSMSANQISSNQMSANQMSANQMSANQMSANQMSANQMSANQMSANQMSANQMSVNQMSANQMTANQMSCNQMSANQMSNHMGNGLNSMMNPPPGMYNNNNNMMLQSTAAQIQAIQQQLALRRSQSSLLNRSTSFQPSSRNAFGNLGSSKFDGLPSAKQSPYSSWSNGQAALSSGWPQQTSGRSAASLFNSLQHSTSNRSSHKGMSHVTSPPRLARSISTPAKYTSYMNGGAGGGMNGGAGGTLDDNPFFRMSDAASAQTGLMSSLAEHQQVSNERMNLSSLESQLYDLIRSSDGQAGYGRHLANGNAGKWPELGGELLFDGGDATGGFNQIASSLNMSPLLTEFSRDRFSRKVFVGGLPPDIDEDEIQASFRQFGPLVVDWPHKAESKSYFPPKGYAFLLFQEEMSVQNLISCCIKDGDKLFLRVSSPTIREKPVQIRPWNLSDSDFVLDGSQPLDPRKTIFVGGVPRPLRAVELAMIMDRLYGGVCYAGIDVDPELKYPKGAGRVAFSNQQSYIAAISARFVQLQHGEIDKRVEVKPYVLDDQHCDECQGARCAGKFAPFFCANVTCLQYYCEHCWATIHSRPGREFHKPLVKEGADRSSRSVLRW